jgi:glycosyltransferase involved in cell wall biosynthesis
VRIALFEPYADDVPRGNSVAAERLARELRGAGHEVRAIVALGTPLSRALRDVRDFAPDVIHALHAFRAAPLAREVAARTRIPFVVSFRGTDAAAGLEHR